MKKGINYWSFAQGTTADEAIDLAVAAGFQGLEFGLAEEGEVALETSDKALTRLRSRAADSGLELPSLASWLVWENNLVSDEPAVRGRARDIIRRQIDAAHTLGCETVLVVPGYVGVDFVQPSEVVAYDAAWERALQAVADLAETASQAGVRLGVKNVWNKFLLSPLEMRAFIDEVNHPSVGVYFDIGNALLTGYPEHWIRILGERIVAIHVKDYRRSPRRLRQLRGPPLGGRQLPGRDRRPPGDLVHRLRQRRNDAAVPVPLRPTHPQHFGFHGPHLRMVHHDTQGEEGKSMIGIAIIGQGYMGKTHAASWRALDQEVLYVCTPRPKGPLEAAPAAQVVTDLDVALSDPAVEIVSVCTPTTTHAQITNAALAAGKNVLLEKPIALSIDDALAIRAAAATASGKLMVAQVVRFFGGHVLLREDVEAGKLGRILSARARRMLQLPDWADWWHDESRSGGAIVDLAIHDFDQMNLFLGRPVAVTSRRVDTYGPFETSIEYADGGLGQVLSHANLAPGAPFTAGISLVGDAGMADYELSVASPTDQDDAAAYPGVNGYRLAAAGGGYSQEVTGDDPYTRQAEYFLSCVRGDKQPVLSSIGSAVRALEVALAARESLHTGQRVTVDSRVSDAEAAGVGAS